MHAVNCDQKITPAITGYKEVSDLTEIVLKGIHSHNMSLGAEITKLFILQILFPINRIGRELNFANGNNSSI